MAQLDLEKMIGRLVESQAETDRQLKRTDRQLEKTDRQIEKTDRQLKELGKQLGRLGNKLGSFTEGMAFPSMKRILQERFHMTHVFPGSVVRKNGRTMEIDVLAYSNTDRNEVYVVEVKSHLREVGLEQILETLRRFPEFFSEHRDKELYGILAAVNVPDNLRARALKAGLYVARVHDDVFELDVPDGFVPRSFQEPA